MNIDSTGNYLESAITKYKIEIIKFELGETQQQGVKSSFDASENQDGSIKGYYTDTNNNGLYELIFLSTELIAPNVNGNYLFQNLTNLKQISFNNFNTVGTDNMNFMFYACSQLTQLDLSKFNTSAATKMYAMFSRCTNLQTLKINNFDTRKVGNFGFMFNRCENLIGLDVSNFDTRSGTAMDCMFGDCYKLTTLDLRGFSTNSVIKMNHMFYKCSLLTKIYVTKFDPGTNVGWTTSKVTNSSYMFSYCNKLVGGNGTIYNSSYTDMTYARIDVPGEKGYLTNIEVITSTEKKPSELFDKEGTNSNGLHIGDFINYDAGNWTQEEINTIKTGKIGSLVTANGSTSLPSTAFQFGGFTSGSSRNGNAIPYNATYNYVKDKATNQAITGWRGFDIEGDKITLISAGNLEDYYHPFVSGQNNYAYISEYILSGNINSAWNSGATVSQSYQKRNWDMYVNRSQYGESAAVLTKEMLDEWYKKYTDTPSANTYTASIHKNLVKVA